MMSAPPVLDHRPRALLLDAGDTVVFIDTRAIETVLAAAGTPVAASHMDAALPTAKRAYQQQLLAGSSHANGWDCLFHTLLVQTGVAPARTPDLIDALKRAHAQLNLWRRVPGGVGAALERAKAAGVRLGIISNSEGKLIQLLEHVGLAHSFELVLDSALEGVAKPDPEIFWRALRRLDLAPSQALYAGDLPEIDVGAARAAGLHGVLVDAYDHHPTRHDMLRVRSVVELVDHLLALPVQ